MPDLRAGASVVAPGQRGDVSARQSWLVEREPGSKCFFQFSDSGRELRQGVPARPRSVRNDSALLFFRACCCAPVREFLSAGGDGARLLGWGKGKNATRLRGQFFEGEGVRATEMIVPFPGGEDGPPGHGDPMDAGEVGSGDAALELEQIGEGCRTGEEGEHGLMGSGIRVESDEGEHLAADGLVAGPEDKIVAPLHRFDDVRKGEKQGANTLDVHPESLEQGEDPGK